jgi:hypothetical protein
MKTKLFKKIYEEREHEDKVNLKVDKHELKMLETEVKDFEEAMDRAKSLVKECIDYDEVNNLDGNPQDDHHN